METKRSKVTICKPWENAKPDTYGNIFFDVVFDNGDKGIHKTNPKYAFSVGQEVDYEIEKTAWKSGKEYFKIKKPKKEANYQKGDSQKSQSSYNNPDVIKHIAVASAQRCAIDLFILFEKKLTNRKELFDLCNSFYHWIISIAIDRDVTSTRQGALSRAVELMKLMGPEYLNIIRNSSKFNEDVYKSTIQSADMLLTNAQQIIESKNEPTY